METSFRLDRTRVKGLRMSIESIIDRLYEDFVGFGLNSHFPAPSIGLWKEECQRLMWCEYMSPSENSIVIGSHNGGSELLLALVKNYKNDHSDIFGVDIHFNEYYDLMIQRLKNRININVAGWEINSNNFNERYKGIDQSIGLAFIDGFHSFKKCYDDFLQVKDYMIKGSVCCFHDCSPKYPKLGSQYDLYFDQLDDITEDFEIDACIGHILEQFPEFQELPIPIGNECDRRREAQRDKFIKGQTSPFNSLFAIIRT